jgi:carbon-monoxide dehydrogenase medium subunit
VDIGRIPGLEYVKEDGGMLRIGAGTRQCVLAQSEVISSRYGVLADAVPLIADPLVRNRGTFGGNVANGDPANDGPAIVIALGAELVARGPQGERTIAANRFYKDLFVTALAPDEILTEIRIPQPPPRSGSAYRKLKRKTGDYAAAASAVQVTLDARGAVQRACIALTNAGPTAIEAVEASRFLEGKTPDEKNIGEASRLAARAGAPSADLRGSVEYKREMARVLTARALQAALERAGRN